MQFVFWLALFLLVYLYVGYPLVAWFRACLRSRICESRLRRL
jgi:hypothetical protein